MSTVELRKRLIHKIKTTNNQELLGEAYRLLEMESDDVETYKLNADQLNAVNEAQQQIKNRQYLTDDQANKEIEEWLKK